MRIGIQLTAPDGYHALGKSVVYHFLRSDAKHNRVLLVHFGAAAHEWKSLLIVVNRTHFEEALLTNQIVVADKQTKRPPWLEELEGINLVERDKQRVNAILSHEARVGRRYDLIKPLLDQSDKILSADNPDKEINRFARSCLPPQKETRVRLMFYTVSCFGNDIWNLMPPFHHIGRWDRQAHVGVKFGRPSCKGGNYGFACDAEMIEKIHQSYIKFRGLGVYMNDIYSRAMKETFCCLVRTVEKGEKTYWHPEGHSYPTFDQYHYHVVKKFGRKEVSRILNGEARVRNRYAASVGQFSASVANLYEKNEADGWYIKETPKGLIEGSPLKPICVIRSADLASSARVGIGFAFGSETSTAYRMMFFSMAIGLQRLGQLFGLQIPDEDCRIIGLPRLPIVDRGPGASPSLAKQYEKIFPIREFTPSFSGQSKATVESLHPRKMQIEGAPSYIQSDLNPVELVKREIQRCIRDNHTTDASDRMTPEMTAAGILHSPNSIWNFLDQRCRTDAQSMPFEEAVRSFLSPVEVTVRNNGVYFNEMRFDSPTLRETGLIDRVARSQVTTIKAYIYDLCLRHIWLDLWGQLLEVDAQMTLRDNDRQLYLSLPELVAFAEAKRAMRRQSQEHRFAATSEYMQNVEDAIGKKTNAGRRRAGRPKTRSPVSLQETADLVAHTSKTKKTA